MSGTNKQLWEKMMILYNAAHLIPLLKSSQRGKKKNRNPLSPAGHNPGPTRVGRPELTRLCSMSRQKRTAFPTSRRFWKHTVFSSAYSTMSFSWWWKNSRMPVAAEGSCREQQEQH